MNMRLLAQPRLAFMILSFAVQAYAADNVNCEVIVTVDQTEAGKKIEPPTHDHPAYYFPIVTGYREEGFRTAGEIVPDRAKIIQQLAKALAKQNYFVVSAKTPPPSVLLVFHWGYINPVSDPTGGNADDGPSAGPITEHEARKMTVLVAGHSASVIDPYFDHDIMDAVHEDRYFVIVIAYDMAAAQKHERKQLWIAKMSTPRTGVSLDDVAGALISSGAPFFGQETSRPKVQLVTIIPHGKVEMGPLETKELFDDTSTPPPSTGKQP